MHTKNLVFYNSTDRQIIEKLCKLMPQFDAINPLTAIVKPIGSVYRLALMVTAQKEKVFRVFNLKCQQQADRRNRKMTSVHIVSQE